MITKRFTVILMAMFALVLNISGQQIMQKNSIELSQILAKDKKIVILDVRTPQEFAAGHLKGAQNIDIYHDNFYTRIDKLGKSQDTLMVLQCGFWVNDPAF